MSSIPSWFLRAAVLGVLAAPHAVAAEECVPGPGESPRDRAKAEYGAGLAAYQEGRLREAIDHLTCANQLVASADLAYNIAVTYDAMGDAASALRWFREYRRQGGADADSAPVRDKLAELEAALQAVGVQQVTIASTPAGATLRVDEQAMGLTPFTLELKPGRHRYRLSAPGRQSADAMFELRADRSLDLAVELAPAATEVPAAPSVAPSAAAPVPGRSVDAGIGTWTWLSLGAGTLLLGGALGVELRRQQLDRELDDVSQARYQDRYDAMSAQQTTARVLFGLGAATLTAGGVLLFLDVTRQPAVSEVGLGPCSDGGLCMAAGGAF
jgi:tetratricopeptide (TPR) repeat protein